MTEVFEELKEGLQQAVDIAENKKPGRVTRVSLYDIRRMSDQDLQRLAGKVINELHDRQKAKRLKLVRQAGEAYIANDLDQYSKLSAEAGKIQATEDFLKEFLMRF